MPRPPVLVDPLEVEFSAIRAQGQAADAPVRLRDPGVVTDVQARPVSRDD